MIFKMHPVSWGTYEGEPFVLEVVHSRRVADEALQHGDDSKVLSHRGSPLSKPSWWNVNRPVVFQGTL